MENIKLRYHHLMCLPRFQGKGYSDDFCKNMQAVKDSVANDNYELVSGCDDICRHCPNMINGICVDEEKVGKYDIAVREAISKGITPTPSEICSDCKWYYICRNVE